MAELDVLLDSVADRIADRVADRVIERLDGRRTAEPERWMTLAETASYLGLTEEALRKRRDLPRSRWGGRLLYRRSAVDAYLDSLAEP